MEISKYFTPVGKRKAAPSSSSTSESDSPNISQSHKNSKISDSFEESETLSKMSIQETLESLQSSMLLLCTKDDIRQLREWVSEEVGKMRSELRSMGVKIGERCEVIEARCHDVEVKLDALEKENERTRKENENLKNEIIRVKNSVMSKLAETKSNLNDLEQYGRHSNLRVFNVGEERGERSDETVKKVCKLFTDFVGVNVGPGDLEACHRVGAVTAESGDRRKRSIIVRFKDRTLRDNILANRKKLKGQKVSVGEDLTAENARLCKEAYRHSASLASWTSSGRVFAKVKNGKTVRIQFGEDVNKVLSNAMLGAVGNV